MSAERLRSAAKVLRERAEAATPGPWGWETYPDFNVTRMIGAHGTQLVLSASSYEDHEDVHVEAADAIYIATVDPTFGLAVAAWLENEAHIARDFAGCDTLYAGPALAVADAILAGGDGS